MPERKMSEAEKKLLDLARKTGHKTYQCSNHGVYSIDTAEKDQTCPYCKEQGQILKHIGA